VLDRLTGKNSTARRLLKALPGKERLRKATPAVARLRQTAAPGVIRLRRAVPGRESVTRLVRAVPGGERVTEFARTDTVSRRRLLKAAPGAAGLLLIAGAASTRPAPEPRATTRLRGHRPHPVEHATVKPVRMPVQRKPIFTLSEYRKVVPGRAFPSDAVALTIDDGPHPVWTPKILRLLDKYDVPALFCMIGNQVLGHEIVARSVVKDGHQLANHTWSHPSTLAHKTARQVQKEIERAQEKIHDTTGYTPKLFRSPGGAWSPALFQEAAKARLAPLDWSDDPRDWSKPGTAAITHRLLAARPGQILLCHDGGGDRSQTYAALRTVLPALKARGYRFVAL
jgi:peptidoglycan/xylan/chitin deacetylase (PgdA/CDA1 family)